jgi:hypothetical protein
VAAAFIIVTDRIVGTKKGVTINIYSNRGKARSYLETEGVQMVYSRRISRERKGEELEKCDRQTYTSPISGCSRERTVLLFMVGRRFQDVFVALALTR